MGFFYCDIGKKLDQYRNIDIIGQISNIDAHLCMSTIVRFILNHFPLNIFIYYENSKQINKHFYHIALSSPDPPEECIKEAWWDQRMSASGSLYHRGPLYNPPIHIHTPKDLQGRMSQDCVGLDFESSCSTFKLGTWLIESHKIFLLRFFPQSAHSGYNRDALGPFRFC